MLEHRLVDTLNLRNEWEPTESDDRTMMLLGPKDGEYITVKEMGVKPLYSVTHRKRSYDKTRIDSGMVKESFEDRSTAFEWVQSQIDESVGI